MKDDEGGSTLSWANAQEQFSLGAGPLSQGSGGSPVNFLDAENCDDIFQGLRRRNRTLLSFDSDSDTPPPELKAAVACDRGTQASSGPSQDQETQVGFVSVQGQETQVGFIAVRTVSDQGTQALILPPRSVSFTQTSSRPSTCDRGTEMQHVTTCDTATQMNRVQLKDRGTSMPSVKYESSTTQTKVYFDNAEIQSEAPRPTLPWGYGPYGYPQFNALLPAYPEVHPEDLVTFGILQPRRGTIREWGEVAAVLSHMIGGRRSLVNELVIIVNRIQRLDRSDPMRATEKQELVNLLLRERRRSAVPRGEANFPPARGTRRSTGSSNSTSPVRGPEGSSSCSSLPIVCSRSPTWAIRCPWGTSSFTLAWALWDSGGRSTGRGPQPGPSRAQGGPRRPSPGFQEFVDLTGEADEKEEIEDAPATPSPNISDDGSGDEIDTDEDGLLSYTGQERLQRRVKR